MLGHTYRYHVYNGTGVSVTCTVKARAMKFASDGSRTDDSEATHINAVSVGTGAYSSSSTVDNSTAKQLFADVQFTAAPGASATGTVALYLQRSTDGGTTWPANGQGQQIAAVTFASSSTSVTTQGVIR